LVLTRNHAEAEDLVQETYVRAVRAVGRLRAGSNMKGWLFNYPEKYLVQPFNQLRKRRNGPQVVEIEVWDDVANSVAEPSKDSHDLYVSKMEAEQVRAAIQELPVQFREIILHCPVGTVMSRLGRTRAKFRTLLAATWIRSSEGEKETHK
jgi:RNA polymerase sigma-70 factor (ECF subfamily)